MLASLEWTYKLMALVRDREVRTRFVVVRQFAPCREGGLRLEVTKQANRIEAPLMPKVPQLFIALQ